MAMNVKFLRGTAAGYAALAEHNADTLYFCTDGKLYLGTNLIADVTKLDTAQVEAILGEALKLYYTKSQVDALLKAITDAHAADKSALEGSIALKADKATVEALPAYGITSDDISNWNGKENAGVAAGLVNAAKEELNAEIAKKENSGVAAGLVNAAKEELNGEIAKKVAQADYDAAMALKADKSELFTKAAADELYEAKGAAAKAIEDANLDQYTTEKEVKDIVDGVIKTATDKETLDSLVELVEYIDTHSGEATQMAGAITSLDSRVKTIEEKPAYGITASQIENWDGEVGAKALAQGVKDVVDANKATWDKAGTALQAADKTELEGKINAKADAATAALKSEVEAVDAKFADYTKTTDLGDLALKDGLTAGEVGAYTKEEVNSAIATATTDMATNGSVDGKLASYRKAADQDVIDAKTLQDAKDYVDGKDYAGIKTADITAWNGEIGAKTAAAAADAKVVALSARHDEEMQTVNQNFTAIGNQLTWGSF